MCVAGCSAVHNNVHIHENALHADDASKVQKKKSITKKNIMFAVVRSVKKTFNTLCVKIAKYKMQRIAKKQDKIQRKLLYMQSKHASLHMQYDAELVLPYGINKENIDRLEYLHSKPHACSADIVSLHGISTANATVAASQISGADSGAEDDVKSSAGASIAASQIIRAGDVIEILSNMEGHEGHEGADQIVLENIPSSPKAMRQDLRNAFVTLDRLGIISDINKQVAERHKHLVMRTSDGRKISGNIDGSRLAEMPELLKKDVSEFHAALNDLEAALLQNQVGVDDADDVIKNEAAMEKGVNILWLEAGQAVSNIRLNGADILERIEVHKKNLLEKLDDVQKTYNDIIDRRPIEFQKTYENCQAAKMHSIGMKNTDKKQKLERNFSISLGKVTDELCVIKGDKKFAKQQRQQAKKNLDSIRGLIGVLEKDMLAYSIQKGVEANVQSRSDRIASLHEKIAAMPQAKHPAIIELAKNLAMKAKVLHESYDACFKARSGTLRRNGRMQKFGAQESAESFCKKLSDGMENVLDDITAKCVAKRKVYSGHIMQCEYDHAIASQAYTHTQDIYDLYSRRASNYVQSIETEQNGTEDDVSDGVSDGVSDCLSDGVSDDDFSETFSETKWDSAKASGASSDGLNYDDVIFHETSKQTTEQATEQTIEQLFEKCEKRENQAVLAHGNLQRQIDMQNAHKQRMFAFSEDYGTAVDRYNNWNKKRPSHNKLIQSNVTEDIMQTYDIISESKWLEAHDQVTIGDNVQIASEESFIDEKISDISEWLEAHEKRIIVDNVQIASSESSISDSMSDDTGYASDDKPQKACCIL